MKNIVYLNIIVLLSVIIGYKDNSNKLPQNFTKQVDNLFENWKADEPGGAVAIIQNENVVFERYFGLANLKTKEPLGANSLTDIGSISKQFTACLIALLEEENRLSIQDDIRKYLPEFPEYQDTIKIKNLLFHTSGVKDYEALELIKGKFYFEDHMTNKYVVDLLSKQKSLNFKPNSEYEYSNSNYILLAEIIERICGKKLNQVATEKIFGPLDMNNTFFNINQGKDFNSRAIGYEYSDSKFERPIYKSHLIGDGAIFTTLSDLVKWDLNFYKNNLGNKHSSLLQRMKYREPLSNGHINNMAFAQIFTPHSFGKNSWSHGGSGGGYRSFYIRFEESKFSVIVLSNSDEKNVFEIANKIVNLYYGVKQEHPKNQNTLSNEEKVVFIESSKDLIENFNGFYRELDGMDILEVKFNADNGYFTVNWKENRDDGYIALPISNTILAEKDDTNYRYEFNKDKNLLVHSDHNKIVKKWKKLDMPFSPIKVFKGNYYSSEVGHQIEFQIFEDKLVTNNNFLSSLYRIGNKVFFDQESLALITFEISEDDVKGFTIDIPRGDRSLRKLKFTKQ